MSMPNGAYPGGPHNGRPDRLRRPSGSSVDNSQDEHSPDFRTILRESVRNARASLDGVPRVLRLVWETNRGFTLSMGVLTIAQSAIPAAQVWLAGQLLQAVVDGVRFGGDAQAVRQIVILAVVALLAPIPAFIASTRYGWHGYQMMRRQSPERRLMAYLTNLLTTDTYNKEIKLFTLGDFFTRRFSDISIKFILENQGLVVRRYLAGFFWGALTILASGGTYLYVALLAVRGTINIAGLTVYTQAAQQVQGNFQGLLSGLSGMYENTLYLNTLFDLLAFEPKIRAPEHPVPVSRAFTRGIEFRNVTYRYPGRDEPVLRDVSFTIAPGETIALVGRNGAGKTTIVKLLTRLYDPDEGQILIDGVDIREYDPADLRHEVGVIFQDYVTYFLSAGENIGVGRLEALADRDRIADSAEQSGADSVIARLPQGYDTTLGKWFDQGFQLSGGEWQKIALARAFMRDAQILVLDEPTAALDAQAEYEIFARMKELTADKTALFISHRFSTVRLADRIMVLEHGRIIESGSHDELLLLDGRYAELFNLQAASYR
jgi:ATP-binding cassette subfamily B protein